MEYPSRFTEVKAKNINISIRPFKGVRVAVPRLASFRQAKHFVILRKTLDRKARCSNEAV